MDKTLQITADFQVGPDVKQTNNLGRFFSIACLRLKHTKLCFQMDKKFQEGKICQMELRNFFPYKSHADLIDCVGTQKFQIHVGQPAHSQLQILRAEQVQNHAEWRCRRQTRAQRHHPLARLPFAQPQLAHPCRVVRAIIPAERE
jgi:hypothetical protein